MTVFIDDLLTFQNLTSIGGDITIDFMGISSLEGLQNINPGSIENITLTNNDNLSECAIQNICDYLLAPNGTVTLYNNAPGCNSIAEIQAACGATTPCLPEGIIFNTQQQIDNFHENYPICMHIEGNVEIVGTSISNLEGLNPLQSIGGYLRIHDSPLLNNLSGLSSLVSIGGTLKINNLPIVNFTGLNALETVGGEVHIVSLPNLLSLDGLDSLSAISGKLMISDNERLHQIDDLISLFQLYGALQVMNNDSLLNLFGLTNLNSATMSELFLFNNPQLSECDVLSICNFLTNPTGPCQIDLNSTGCNSIGEVQAACLTSVTELTSIQVLLLSPNPASSFITITIPQGQTIEEIIIHNQLGQKVLTTKPVNNVIDVSQLKPGIYFIDLAAKDWRGRTKFIKH